MTPQILLPLHKDAILAFGREQLRAHTADPTELEFKSWSAPWRAEALDHFLPLGWSFGIFDGDSIRAVLLGQPLLFHRALTQTLNIEFVEAKDPESLKLVLETAYRWSRDKHMQCVLFESTPLVREALSQIPGVHALEQGRLEWRTSRFK